MPGFIGGKIPEVTARQLVINKINTLTNFEFWAYQNEFIKWLDIAEKIDKQERLSLKQAQSINRFLGCGALVNEKLKEVTLRNGEKYQPY